MGKARREIHDWRNNWFSNSGHFFMYEWRVTEIGTGEEKKTTQRSIGEKWGTQTQIVGIVCKEGKSNSKSQTKQVKAVKANRN